MAVVPDHIKKNVRAVLLSKVGGILVSDFIKDYKSLLREQLNYRQLGFDNLNDFIKAMPDVVRLEFSDKDMAYKMFGIVDPSDSYTPLIAKKAAGAAGYSPEKIDRRNMANNSVNGDYPDFLPNPRGHYTLCYPRSKEGDNDNKEILEEKFQEFGSLFEVHLIPRMIFVRFTSKDSAIACLEKYSSELSIRIADEKKPSKGPPQNNNRHEKRDSDTIIPQKKPRERSSNKEGVYEVYIGNLASNATEEDIEAICSEFSPSGIRCCKRKDDPRKVFAFVDFSNPDSAQSCVDKLNKLEHKGRTLNVRLADESAQSKQKTQSQAPAAPSGGKISWRSGGGQTSNNTSSGIAALDNNDDECWDMEDKNNNSTDKTEKSSSSFGQSSSSFGQSSSSFGQTQSSTSFGQSSSSSFGQKSPSSGQDSTSTAPKWGQKTTSSFGQNSTSDEQKMSTFGKSNSAKEGGSSFGKGTKKDSRDCGDCITLYFGNLHSSITEEVFTDLVKDFSPTDVRIRKDKNDERKIFGFITVSSESIAEEVVSKFHEMDYNGRKMKCRISNQSGQSSSRPNNSETAPTGKTTSWRSGSNNSNNDGESRDTDKKNSFTSNKLDGTDINQKFGSLSIRIDNTQSESAIPPVQQDGLLETPPKSMMLLTANASPQKMSPVQHTTNRSPQKMSPMQQMTSRSLQKMSSMQQTTNRSPQKSPRVNHINAQDYNSKKTSSSIKMHNDFAKMSAVEPVISDEMPPLEPAVLDEMPPLEPAVDEGMPPLEHADGYSRVWVANFPYYETEDDLMYLFGRHGAVDVYMVNQTNRQKTTGAVILFPDETSAELAMLQTNQSIYKERLLWVQMYESNPEKRNRKAGINLNISISAGSDGRRSVKVGQNTPRNSSQEASSPRSPQESQMKGATSCESVSSTHSAGTVARNFRSLLHTYKIIMNKLGTRVRDIVFQPRSEVIIYITSVYDDNNFWGQVIQDETTLDILEQTLEMLQDKDSRIGYTKGLGRCAAKIGDQWFRSWIVADRHDFMIEVFNVDYGNTAVISKKEASLTLPEIWDLPPAVRPFRIANGTLPVNKSLEQSLVNVEITGTNADDTGFLTEVTVLGVPE